MPTLTSSAPEILNDRFNQASQDSNASNLEKALTLYTAALALNPKHIPSLLGRSEVYRLQRKLQLALEDLNMAVREDINNALYARGRFYVLEGQYKYALSDITLALNNNPLSIDALQLRAFLFFQQEEYKKALNDFDFILTRHPTHDFSLAMRMQTHCLLGNYEAALTDANDCLKIKSSEKVQRMQVKLINRLTRDNIANHNQSVYISRKRSTSVIQMHAKEFMPVTQRPAHGRSGLTRFFTSGNQQLVVKSGIEDHKPDFKREGEIWTHFYPREAALWFEFEHEFDSFRLVLPKFQGEVLYDLLKRSPPSYSDYLLLWLDIGLELHRFNHLGYAHIDFKTPNVIANCHPAGFIHTHLIDFGTAEAIGSIFKGFSAAADSHHIAPELFNKIKIHQSVDVFSFAYNFRRYFKYKKNTQPDNFYHFFRSANSHVPSERPSLTLLLEKLISEIATPFPFSVPSPLQQLCTWLRHLEPERFDNLLDVMNGFDKNTQLRFQQPELMSEISRKFHHFSTQQGWVPSHYQHLNAFVLSLILGFMPRLRDHLSSPLAVSTGHTFTIKPDIPLDRETHLPMLIHYHESLNSPLGLLICGLLLDGSIATRGNEPQPSGYWSKQFHDAITFYIQATKLAPTLQPYVKNLLQTKGIFSTSASLISRIKEEYPEELAHNMPPSQVANAENSCSCVIA